MNIIFLNLFITVLFLSTYIVLSNYLHNKINKTLNAVLNTCVNYIRKSLEYYSTNIRY